MKNCFRSFSISVLALAAIAVGANAQTTSRVSVSTGGIQGNGASPDPHGARLSGNGLFVAFKSTASNLVAGDTNGYGDVFVRNLALGTTTRVSIATDGSQAVGGDSNNPSISADGRYVCFTSFATNLVSGGTTGSHIYVRDTLNNTTNIVSVNPAGLPANGISDSSAISGDGQIIAFRSSATDLVLTATSGSQVFARNMTSGTTVLVSTPDGVTSSNGSSGQLQQGVSADGRYVGFSSNASNLVAGDTNGTYDVFLRDLQTSTTERVSVGAGGVQGNGDSYSSVMSSDGRYVAFSSTASNLVTGDTNGHTDVFLRDRQLGTTTRISVDSSGKQGNLSSGTGNGWGVSISGDGRYVAFQSLSDNLIGANKDKNGVEDVFLKDRTTGKTTMISVTSAGSPANGASGGAFLSADGRYVSFFSLAANLVAGDTNGYQDVFVRGPLFP